MTEFKFRRKEDVRRDRRKEDVLRTRMQLLFEREPMDPVVDKVGEALNQVSKRLDEDAASIVKSQ